MGLQAIRACRGIAAAVGGVLHDQKALWENRMPIDIWNEELFTLGEAARRLKKVTRRRIATTTLWRWCSRGIKGTRLEYCRVGRNIMTTQTALSRFCNVLAARDSSPSGNGLPGLPSGSQTPASPAVSKAADRNRERTREILRSVGL